MNTKTKMMLGLSVLTAGTLAAGATGTFAWFTTNKTAKATYSNIIAVGTQGDLKASISSVTGGTGTIANDNTSNVSMAGSNTYITDVSSNDGFTFVQPDWVGEAGNAKPANKLNDVSTKAGYFTQYLVTLKNVSKSSTAGDSVEVYLNSLKVTFTGGSTESSTAASANWVRVAIFSKDGENVSTKDVTAADTSLTNKFLDVETDDLIGVYSNEIVNTTETAQGNDKYVSAITDTTLTISNSTAKAATTLTANPEKLISELASTTDVADTSKTRTIGVSVWLEGTAADNQDNFKGATVTVDLEFTSKTK